MASVSAENQSQTPSQSEGRTWIDRIDRWCETQGDRLTPILVKETRQALKSRQFVVTFSVLLVAALAWTIIGSLSMMPAIYDSPSASRMLIGYYIVLAIPMLIVVPMAAYRSLEGEIDDGTLELLSITVLSPWQIVLGKLASASLQMLLYFVALFPCVAYAYTLRGVDLPTVGIIVSVLLVAGLLLTIAALFFAPLSRGRSGRIMTLLALLCVLIAAEWGLAVMVIGMILYGNPLTTDQLFFAVIASVSIAVSLGHLMLVATAAQLTPESENRSTHLRVSLLLLTAIVMGLAVLAMEMLDEMGPVIAFCFCLGLAGLWTLTSSMMCAESAIVTPRVRRQLPSSFLARMTLTWLTPGPTTGLVFSAICVSIITSAIVVGASYYNTSAQNFVPASAFQFFQRLCISYSVYLIGMLIAVRWLISIIRINNHPRVELGIAALIAVAVLSSLVPYSVGLHMNDYRNYEYSAWQITNWVWTIGQATDRPSQFIYVVIVGIVVAIALMVSLLLDPKLVFARRIATPKRVLEEQKRLAAES
ncbi:ABC-2 family transporter protein [Rubripirellula obstinata]|uniref:ABC-2 family transporter protein n=1 Tax=Rubripirellula obstinata TaxID=406547 RepID=A0A5B1CMJ8_9BACT|nr:ABC transporter permease [Rubripirellula obstinata]KAA1262407.1 ABC-2 family transporter protein [Rubripirellula obstinata]